VPISPIVLSGGPSATASSNSTATSSSGSAFIGMSSRNAITNTVSAVIPAASRNSLFYYVAGSSQDYACAVWAVSAPTFTPTNVGTTMDTGVPGGFILQGGSTFGPSTPPATSNMSLWAQAVATVSDNFVISANW
jgi:hypothetical protein